MALRTNFALYIISGLVYITEVESVYSAVRTESIYNTYVLLSVGLPVANAPDVLQPCGLLYYP